MMESACSYNPSEESEAVQISVPFKLINGKPQSCLVGETKFDSVTVKNISGGPLYHWSVSICDAEPENSFIDNFRKLSSLKDRVLNEYQCLTIWLSCKPTKIGLHSAAVHFAVGNETIKRIVHVLAEDSISMSLTSKKPYQRVRRSNRDSTYTNSAFSLGPRPPNASNRGPGYKLPKYPIPKSIRTVIEKYHIPKVVIEGLTSRRYASFFKALLAMEEIKLEELMHAYDMRSVTLKGVRNHFLSLEVPGLAEKRPSLVIGDYILAKVAFGRESFQGYIHSVEAEEIHLKFNPKFHRQHRCAKEYDVQFTYNRTAMRRLYQALDAASRLSKRFLFPSAPRRSNLRRTPKFVPISCSLNKEQMTATQMILSANGGFPYVIHGPPGTGKTTILVEAILQLYIMNRAKAILVCAPSNSAADHLLEKLISEKSIGLKNDEIFRLNAYTRPLEDIYFEHMEFCYIEDDICKCPTREVLEMYRIIITTYTSAVHLYAQGLDRGHFSHIFLDEAAQASEPEAMIPLSHFCANNTVVVLAGDPKQLGTVVFSKNAESCGLKTSYLERLLRFEAYSDGKENFIINLVRNYRTHEAILRLPSKLFYDGKLIPSKKKERFSPTFWDDFLPNKYFPLLFSGIQGCCEKERTDPSWFNRIEVSKVADTISLLKEKGLNVKDIGVITPYRQQASKIRCILKRLGMANIKVGSVEQFQGQEKEVIIVSTVRSTFNHNENGSLGFLTDSRRFNVAVTRAKSLLVVIGDPHILCKDRNWKELLWYCVDNGSYIGCFLPEKPSQNEDISGMGDGNDDPGSFNGNWDDPHIP